MASRASPSAVVSGRSSLTRAFEEEFDYVYRTFRRLGVQPAEADDLAQEVFVVLWRRWSDFQRDRPLRPWLAGIAHRVAMDHARKHRRREVATSELEQEDEAPGPDERLASARVRHLALRALAMLPERHRSVLVRHELDGVPIRGIAKEWSIPFFTVAARLRRARVRFQKAVKQLQLGGGKRGALLPAQLVLEAERSVPPVPPVARALMRTRLTSSLGDASNTIGRAAVPAAAPLPRTLVAAIGAGTLGVLLLIAFVLRAAGPPDARKMAHVVSAARRPPSQPRLVAPRPTRLVASDPAPAALVAPGPVNSSAEGLSRRLVAHWAFEDGPGSLLAQDSSGNGRPCLLHDLDVQTAWVEGPVGRALDLGATGWLECPLPEARAGVPFELSVAVWMKQVPTKQQRDSVLLTRQLDGAGPSHLFWFGVREDFLAVWSWEWNGWTTGSLPPPGVWTHVAFVHGGQETRLYVNGALVRHKKGQLPRSEGLVQSALTIGGSRYQADPLRVRHHFDGLVDEAVIYDRVLGEAEITALVARGR